MIKNSGKDLSLFSNFYAVVLYHEAGSGLRVRWSPTHEAWLRNSDYDRYTRRKWHKEPGESFGIPDGPTGEDCSAALSLAHRMIGSNSPSDICQRCWNSNPGSHFIAPDVYGDPKLYCIQVPCYSTVDSSGGTGRVKHWGSPFGCQSVDSYIDSNGFGSELYIGPLAAYVFGKPLPADEVINRGWCSRCSGAAYNVRHNASQRGRDEVELTREQVQIDVTALARKLERYYGKY